MPTLRYPGDFNSRCTLSSPSDRELDYFTLVARNRCIDNGRCSQTIRVALLSDAATQQFVPLLNVLFDARGLHCTTYEGVFDGIELEACDPRSNVYEFQPDSIILLYSVQAFADRYYRRPSSARDFLAAEASQITRVLDTIRAHSSALVLLSNFVMPYERFFGNYDHSMPESLYSVVAEMNRRIEGFAAERRSVLLNDVEAVASWRGRRQWFDDRAWCLSKAFCCLDELPYLAQNIVDIISTARGRSVKCIALDLDDTLWGGVIGDDGLDRIRVSAHGDGEPFYRFQRYLIELKKRGILLAVCSKNEPENARLPFRYHPEMLIREQDIAAFIANWDDKSENLKRLHDILNIGLESIVFIDDNPFERNLIRNLVPEVIVPEMPEDTADYVKVLSELNLFETVSFSEEDARRSELYLSQARSEAERTNYASFEEYLISLEMKLTIGRFDNTHLARITQLFQRTNQFNLTTNRYSAEQCKRIMGDHSYLPLYAQLRDRFGDHGLIGIVVIRFAADVAAITDWLISCRVFRRGVEQELMNYVFEVARAHGAKRVTGRYLPTAKNRMVRDFYLNFGFQRASESPAGEAEWVLPVKDYQPQNTHLMRQS